MNVERWRQIDKIFQDAIELSSEERAAFLDRACADDPALRQDVEALIRSDAGAGSFLKSREIDTLSDLPLSPSGSLNGKTFGPYEVKALLGAGGMGEVYRARDTKLKRDVAIKTLQVEFLRDAGRLARFQREAEVQASLNHPHIAAIYDLAAFEDVRFLVLELVEGETLADRLVLGPIPIDAALRFARQTAEALEAAHEKGIVHRDLKPANIKITPEGKIKVLDFGLAKVLTYGTDLSSLPTQLTLSAPGSVLGTAAYMSPEQARGREADRASDVWAFGCVLYEMLTGHAVFEGETMGEIFEGIFKCEPDWNRLPSETPEGLRRLVRRCLQKDETLRFRDIRDARLEIGEMEDVRTAESKRMIEGVSKGGNESSEATPSAEIPAAKAPQSRRRRVWLWATVAGLAVLGGAKYVAQRSNPPVVTVSTGAPASPIREANDLFELARFLGSTQNEHPRAIENLKRALALDPNFSEARRVYASYLVIHFLNGFSNDVGALYTAEEELNRVVREAPNLPGLAGSQAAIYMTLGKKDKVPRQKLAEGWRSDPDGITTVWYMILLQMTEQTAKLQEVQEAVFKRMPNFGAPRMFLGEALRNAGDIDGAIREQKRVLEQANGNIASTALLNLAYLDAGKLPQARALLESKRGSAERNYLWRHAWALLLAAEGKHEEADLFMEEETLKFARRSLTVTAQTADFYAMQGKPDKAIEWLDIAVRNGDERIGYFRRNPRLASIRDDDRFKTILRSVEADRKR